MNLLWQSSRNAKRETSLGFHFANWAGLFLLSRSKALAREYAGDSGAFYFLLHEDKYHGLAGLEASSMPQWLHPT